MIFIFDFIFCPDDKEKFAANARNYDYTHIIIIDFKEQEKKISILARRRCRNFQKNIHTYILILLPTP